MTEILVIQNAAVEGIGQLGKMLENDGYTLKTINAKQDRKSTRLNSSHW